MATFGKRIQELRKNMEMTQKEFADHLGIPQPTISAYENDKNNPTMDVLLNISDKCHVSIDWLCGKDSRNLINVTDILNMFCELTTIKNPHVSYNIGRMKMNNGEYALPTFEFLFENLDIGEDIKEALEDYMKLYWDYCLYRISEEEFQNKRKELLNSFNEKHDKVLTIDSRPKLSEKQQKEYQLKMLQIELDDSLNDNDKRIKINNLIDLITANED